MKSDTETETMQSFIFNGTSFPTYQDMVNAKRKRNRDMLASSGLLEAKVAVDNAVLEEKRRLSTASTTRGLKRSSEPKTQPSSDQTSLPRRKSSRLAGVSAPNIYIESEGLTGNIEFGGGDLETKRPSHYNNRVNDGSDLTIADAVELTGSKWVKEGTVESAEYFLTQTLPDIIDDSIPISSFKKKTNKESPTSVTSSELDSPTTSASAKLLRSQIASLSVDDPDTCVAKVTPDRIYSVVCHPCPDKVIVCAGDKQGHLGIWNVDQYGGPTAGSGAVHPAKSFSTSDGVHLFKPHSGSLSTMSWNNSGTSLLSSSYDGSVRAFDVENQVFEEIFATYDDDDMYKDKLGFGTDNGYNSWIQSMELDHRFESGKCFFLSTSEGCVMHIDLRSRSKLTFNRTFSEKKINTVSFHPNGSTMATAGLTGIVQLWDVRSIPSNSSKAPKPFAWQNLGGRSINSAFFSPSGKRLLTTTQSDKLQIFEDVQTKSGLIQPLRSIHHDNQTGRWLSTFMARWHPTLTGQEIFVVGSMTQPRCMEIFSHDAEILRAVRGDAMTAVASRCCFHSNANKLVVVGGSSSGRVTVAR